jgi:hypothetical protein
MLSVATELSKHVEEYGGSKDFYWLAVPASEPVVHSIAHLIAVAGQRARNSFVMPVDYDLQLDQLVALGQINRDHVDSAVCEGYRSSSSEQGQRRREFKIFSPTITNEEKILAAAWIKAHPEKILRSLVVTEFEAVTMRHMHNEDFQPATLPELLQFSGRYWKMQEVFNLSMVAFGSWWKPEADDSLVPCVYLDFGSRHIKAVCERGWGMGWCKRCVAVGVRDPQQSS